MSKLNITSIWNDASENDSIWYNTFYTEIYCQIQYKAKAGALFLQWPSWTFLLCNLFSWMSSALCVLSFNTSPNKIWHTNCILKLCDGLVWHFSIQLQKNVPNICEICNISSQKSSHGKTVCYSKLDFLKVSLMAFETLDSALSVEQTRQSSSITSNQMREVLM